MVTESDFIIFHLYGDGLLKCRKNAYITIKQKENGEITGDSQIFKNRKKRQKRIYRDASIGQIGNLGLNQMLFGEKQGIIMYQKSRDWHNANPTASDHGSDAIGFQIDIKTSGYNYPKKAIIEELMVRPNEQHGRFKWVTQEEHDRFNTQIYIHAYCQTFYDIYDSPYNQVRDNHTIIQMTGWCWGPELPMKSYGPEHRDRKGTHAIDVVNLHRMINFPIKDIWWVQQGMKKEIK
jgi:hypothetical protein